ncbi:MAG TPA: hypothetical protein VNL91_07275, partial [Thermoanaerobaculia bacterium]|nr:hypothetical protein [Thermoanaerobaculia bacterium]
AIAHQDDVYERSWISTLAGALDRHPTAFAAHCKAIVIDASGVPVADNPAAAFKERFWPGDGRELLRPPETELQMLTRGNYVIAPSVVYRTDAVRQLGGFDVSFQFVLDWDYWIRGVSRGWRLVGVPQRLLRLRIHPGAKTHAMETTLQRYEEELRLLQTIPQSLRRRYGLVENTVLSAFAERLAAGDSDGAHALHEFARARIPRFSGSARDHLMRLALRIGRAAGRLLVAAERFYLTSTRLSRRR